ncbi:MAG: hypothetical protein J6B77_00275, partial [Clostridia bacterium]|nr:hypothetical protein [Clostridia bacterium]
RRAATEAERDKAQAEANSADAALGELLDALNACDTAISDAKLRLSILENAQKSGADRKEALEGEIEDYKTAVAELDERFRTIKAKADEYETMLSEAQTALDAAEEALTALSEKRDRTQEALASAKFESGSIEQRIRTIRTMDEQFEGYSGSVRFLMKRYNEGTLTLRDGRPCGTIYGPLSRVITVEDRYVTAIETALGANLGHIVTEDDETAKAAMYLLKSAKAGRATFFPLTSMQPSSVTPDMEKVKRCTGFIAVADELVKTEDRFHNVISNLLGRILIFDNIEHATEAARACRFRVKLVTLDGQVINAGGSFTGGSTRDSGTILGRQAEIRRLEEDLKKKQETVTQLSQRLDKIVEEIRTTPLTRNSASDKCKVVEMLRNAELRRAEQAEAEKSAQETLLSKLLQDLAAIETARTQAEEDSASIAAELRALTERSGEIRAIRSDKDAARNEALDRRTALDQALLELTLTVRDAERDIESDRQREAEAEERVASLHTREEIEQQKIEDYRTRIEEMRRRNEENRAQTASTQAELDARNTEYAGNSADSAEYEARLSDVSARIRRKSEEKEQLLVVHMRDETRLTSLREAQDKLNSQLWDEYELTRADAVALGYPPLEA